MLKAKVGYSINPDDVMMGYEACKKSNQDFNNVKLNFLYTSSKNDIKKVLKGAKEATNAPIIGCTSSGGIIVPEGYVSSPDGFVGVMSLNDSNMTVGVACHEGGKDPRAIGRKVAIKAVEDAKTTRAPAYFYMVSSPKEEEEYLMGIQDVIGRVPMFGGSAADDTVEGNWEIICNDQSFSDGIAVAFFYTDNEIVTTFRSGYKETNNYGLITEVKNKRTIVSIDGISSLKKYGHWIDKSPNDLHEKHLLISSINKPLGIKDPLGNLTVVRHPIFGNDMHTKTTTDDTITLSNKVVEKTTIIQLEATNDELINSVGETLKILKKEIYADPALYILIHSGGIRLGLGSRVTEVYKQALKEAGNVPFIIPFTFGEYGYSDHSSNICGGLMLSFTAFGKN